MHSKVIWLLLDANARAEGVDARRQWICFATEDATEDSSSEIDPLGIGIKAPVYAVSMLLTAVLKIAGVGGE